MKRYLLDTNICVHFMRQKFGVDEYIEKVGWEHCCISEVTVAELLFGAEPVSYTHLIKSSDTSPSG